MGSCGAIGGMSFGVSAASYVDPVASGLVQQSSGTWSGTTMSVALPAPTHPASTLALIIAGNTTVPTPSGWTLREGQVNWMGHYLFTRSGGSNNWSIPTANGMGTWYVVEVGNATYGSSASANESWDYSEYATPSLVPSVGNCLLLASIASGTDTNIVRTLSGWTGGFVEVADICNPTGDYPMQGVAILSGTGDSIASFSTSATFSSLSVGRSAIITALTL